MPVTDSALRESPDAARAGTLAAASLGMGVVQLDVFVVNVGVRQIGAAFGGGTSGLQWMVSAYTLMFAALGLIFCLSLLFQQRDGYSALRAGLAFLPMSAAHRPAQLHRTDSAGCGAHHTDRPSGSRRGGSRPQPADRARSPGTTAQRGGLTLIKAGRE